MKRLALTQIIIAIVALLLLAGQVCAKMDFEEAVASLNTPKLVNKWLMKNFNYDHSKVGKLMKAARRGKVKDSKALWEDWINYPSETYYSKKGGCFDAANFAAYCLYKAGYDAHVFTVKYSPARGRPGSHTVCICKENEKWYVLANTWKGKQLDVDFITGPYENLKKVASSITAIDRTWTSYFLDGVRKKFEGQKEMEMTGFGKAKK